MSTELKTKRICVIGCGPAGMSALYHFSKLPDDDMPEIVCYEKQDTWGGLWNRSWRTGTDKYGEHLHSSMYYDMWTNIPKEAFEYDDYTYEEHFGKLIPSYVTVPVIRDYLEGRFRKAAKRDLRQFVKFSTVVSRVDYLKDSDNFKVLVKDLPTDTESEELFTHVIVATGTFQYPQTPEVSGLEQFKGRILHSKDVKQMDDFKGQRVLIIGSRWSAEDLAVQAYKFGAERVLMSWRNLPHWVGFPKVIEQHPAVEKLENKTAYFRDGYRADVDMIIFCTGYRWHFPFMADNLRLKEQFMIASKDLYKTIVWLNGGNGKVLYIGAQYSPIFTFVLLEAQSIWSCKYIMGEMNVPSQDKMIDDSVRWLKRFSEVDPTSFHDMIPFLAEALADICEGTGYNKIYCTHIEDVFKDVVSHKIDNILTYRDKQFKSIYTGKVTPLHHTHWLEAFDDSLEAFGLAPTPSA